MVLLVETALSGKSSLAAYLILIPEGDVTIAEIPTPLPHHAPSQ
jgi:hypothetical protein